MYTETPSHVSSWYNVEVNVTGLIVKLKFDNKIIFVAKLLHHIIIKVHQETREEIIRIIIITMYHYLLGVPTLFLWSCRRTL